MPMVEWLVVVHSDASSSCPIVRTDASHMVVGQTTSLEACGEPRSWGSPSREQGGQKRSMSAKMRVTIPRAHGSPPESLGAAHRLVKRRP